MKVLKRIICIVMIAALAMSIVVASTISPAASGSGVGLAEWAMRAYYEGWSYVWGGDSVGAVDCSGMITSYCGGNRTSMLADAQAHGRDWGYVSDGIPNIHGLGLSRPNHVGVYVGNGMEVDARGSDYGVCYQAVGDRWNCWFKLTAITYPTTGWEKFNGDSYYYENGEYLTDTTRTIDGVTYYFASSGVATKDSSSVSSSTSSSSNSQSSAPAAAAVEDNGPLKKGSKGTKVEKLQARLQELGYYNGSVDGDFGEMTEKAFKLFQEQAGLYVDGIAGSDADYLYSDDAPAYVPAQKTATLKNETASTGSSVETAQATVETIVPSFSVDHDDDDDNDSESDNDTDAEDVEDDEQEESADAEEAEEEPELRYAAGDNGDAIYTIQSQLIKLGYLDGGADGSFGAITENAVRQFQTANKLNDTGVIDQNTYDVLFSGTAVKYVAPAEGESPTSPAPIIAATTAMDTAAERDNAALAQRSVAAISDNVSSRKSSSSNLEFVVWLAIMIVVMLVAFAIVYLTEKKRARAMAHAGRRFQ